MMTNLGRRANLTFYLSVVLLLGMLTSCTGGVPVVPEGAPASAGNNNSPALEELSSPLSNHHLWGSYNFTYDIENMQIGVVPSRYASPHFDITDILNPPACNDCLRIEVLEFKPADHYVKLKVILWNKTKSTGYDIRGIMLSDISGIRLLNADSYTDLWDDGGSVTINPFRVFATDQPQHEFEPGASHARIYEIEYSTLPDLAKAMLVVDASWPSNCKEPYSLSNFIQVEPLSTEGGSTEVKVSVYDWQDNAEGVSMDASSIGGGLVEFSKGGGFEWLGTLTTAQINYPAEYTLLAQAGSADSPLKTYNFFNISVVNIPSCAPEGNETWETATELPPAQNSNNQVVCLDDKADWYKFLATSPLSGSLKLDVLNNTGLCDITFYADPDGLHLVWKTADYANDAIIQLDPLGLGAGNYYIRVRHIGSDPLVRQYILYNNALIVPCEQEGNEIWQNATSLPMGEQSGMQVLCLDDMTDWYEFSFDGHFGGNITFELLNDSGLCGLDFYRNPAGAPLLSGEASYGSNVVFDFDPLELPGGSYYLKARFVGDDPIIRQYILYNNAETWPCEPEGNETWQDATPLDPGADPGAQVVCATDKNDWYIITAAIHLKGTLTLGLTNDTGPCGIALYENPSGAPLVSGEAVFGTDATIDVTALDLGPGAYYININYVGDDLDVRDYILSNDLQDSNCYPDNNNSYHDAIALPLNGYSEWQYTCLDDKTDWFKFETPPADSNGTITLVVADSTGPADMTLYDEAHAPFPDGPHIAWKEANPTATIDLGSLTLEGGVYYIRVRHIGNDALERKFHFEMNIQVTAFPHDISPPWLNFSPEDIVVSGNYAYTACGVNGVHIFDITVPWSPQWISMIDTPGHAYGLCVSGDHLFVADGTWGLLIIDISNPASPQVTATLDMGDECWDVEVSGDYAFIAGWAQFMVVDIDPIDTPSLIHSFDSRNLDIVLVPPSLAYTANNSLFYIQDINPPELAYNVSSLSLAPHNSDWREPPRIAVNGAYAYVALHEDGLKVIWVPNPSNPQLVATLPMADANDVAIYGNYAVVADDTGLVFIDITNPLKPSITKTVDTGAGDNYALLIKDGYAYVCNRQIGLMVVGIDPLDTAHVVGNAFGIGDVVDVKADGGKAYVATNSGGLFVVDVDPPGTASILGRAGTMRTSISVDYSNGYAYVADDYYNFEIFDVDPPDSPYQAGYLYFDSMLGRLCTAGGYCYLIIPNYVPVIDIDPPGSEHVVNIMDDSGLWDDLDIKDNRLYLLADSTRFQIYDIAVPESPELLKEMKIDYAGGGCNGVAVDNGYAYVAYSGLYIVDVDPPEDSHVVNHIYFGEDWYASVSLDVCAAGGLAFLCDRDAGVVVIDVSSPEAASVEAVVPTQDIPARITIAGNYLFVAERNAGLGIYEIW